MVRVFAGIRNLTLRAWHSLCPVVPKWSLTSIVLATVPIITTIATFS